MVQEREDLEMHFQETETFEQRQKATIQLEQALARPYYQALRRNTEEEFLFGTRMVRMDSVCVETDRNLDSGGEPRRPMFGGPLGLTDYGSKKYSKT